MNNEQSKYYRNCNTFIGPDGARVQELTICDVETGKPMTQLEWVGRKIDEPLSVYLALVTSLNEVLCPMQTPNGPSMSVSRIPSEIHFGIEATSLKEAFEKYPATIETIRQEMIRRQEEAAKQSDKPGILVAQESDVRSLNSRLKLAE